MTDTEDQKPEPRWWDTSAAYRKAYEDIEFLNQDELRPVRLQLELLKPELTLLKRRIRSTIVVFGGTRIVEPADARGRLAALEKESAAKPDDQQLLQRLAAARRIVEKSRFYDEARRFGSLVSQANDKDEAQDFVIITGGGPKRRASS